jgi:hypothetical protein
VLTHLFVRLTIELIIEIVFVEIAMKTWLVCVAVCNVKLSPHDDSCSFQLGLLVPELAREVTELWGLVSDQLWDYTHLVVLIMVQGHLGSIDKCVFLAWMSMHINERQHFFCFFILRID